MTTVNTSINKLTADSTEQTQEEYRKQKGREAQLRYRQKNREKLNTASKAYNSQPFTCVICNMGAMFKFQSWYANTVNKTA